MGGDEHEVRTVGTEETQRTERTEEWSPDDPDRIDDLADEITTLAAHIHAATHRLLTLLAAFDRLNG